MKRKPILAIVLCNLFLALTVAFFQPMEVVLANLQEFLFPFGNIWWLQLLVAAGVALILSLVMLLLPPRAGRIAASVSLGLGLACWVQAMFLNGGMVSLTGAEMTVTSGGIVLNAVIWFLIALLVVAMVSVFSGKDGKKAETAMCLIAGALTVMQGVGFVSLVATTDTSARKVDHYLSAEGDFTLSQGANTIVFVLDTADECYVNRMLEKYPEMNDILSGWVYYTNTTSTFSRTYPSITYLLTGEKSYFDREPEQCINEAFEKSDFLKRIHDDGTDVRVFTMDPILVGNETGNYIDNSSNYSYTEFGNLDLPNLEQNLTRISLYKCLPYFLKKSVSYDLEKVNATSFRNNDRAAAFANYVEPDFYAAMMNSRIALSDQYSKAFRFYHLWGAHPGWFWNERLEGSNDSAPEDALRGSFLMLQVYTALMRETGVYDDATIIVTADHGLCGGSAESLDLPAAPCPIIMVKYPHSDEGQSLIMNKAPVCQDDLFATIESSLGISASGTGSGKALVDFQEDEERVRYYYYSALYSDDDGEVALREYEVRGDANDLNSYKETGKWWDIDYSINKVSKRRFSEE